MNYIASVFILVMTMYPKQKKPPTENEKLPLQKEGSQPIPDDAIRTMITTYFEALNQQDADTLMSLTHPSYITDIPSLLKYIRENSVSFEILSISLLMDQKEFRETVERSYKRDMMEPKFSRGLSYDTELMFTKAGKSYHMTAFYVDVAETKKGWKILDPLVLQTMAEIELEVIEKESQKG